MGRVTILKHGQARMSSRSDEHTLELHRVISDIPRRIVPELLA